MPNQKYNVKRSRKSKNAISFMPKNLTMNRSGHLITSRAYGSGGRFTVLIVAAVLFIFALMSIYGIYLMPLAPAAWAMLIFFGGLALILLAYEDNIFPTIGNNKIVYLFIAWFLAFVTIPFVISLFQVFQFGVLIFIMILLLPLCLVALKVFLPNERWQSGKEQIKGKLHIRHKKTKAAVAGVRGVNRKRKIYRR